MSIDNSNELFPQVNEQGEVIGCITRGEAHNGSMVLHPVVHLHVFNANGELYLQKRPQWKDIQPNKWDTACGGHVSYGEEVLTALRREVHEEMNIHSFQAEFLVKYPFRGEREYELVHVYKTVYEGPIQPNLQELEGGAFWKLEDILAQLGKGVFTPNFENEFKTYLLPLFPVK